MPSQYPILSLAPVIGLAVCCLSHILFAYFSARKNPYPPLLLAYGAGLLATLVISLRVLPVMGFGQKENIALLAFGLVTYLALGLGYLSFVNLNLTALRIRILDELLTCGHDVTTESLRARYGIEQVIAVRIERLASTGHLVKRDGRFYTGRRNLLISARIYRAVISILRGLTGMKTSQNAHHADAVAEVK